MSKQTDSDDDLLDAIAAVENLLLSKIFPDSLYLGETDSDDESDDDDALSARSDSKRGGGGGKSSSSGPPPSSSSSLVPSLRVICRDALPLFSAVVEQQSSSRFTAAHRSHHSSYVEAVSSALALLVSRHGYSSLASFRSALSGQMSAFSGEGKEDDVRRRVLLLQKCGEVLEVLEVALDFTHFAESMVMRAEQFICYNMKEGDRGEKEKLGAMAWKTGRRR